jgi:leader peptidase (prepilin peptidase) / N-methyltransferase
VVSSAALLVVLFVGGLLVGSFLNVVIARVPQGRSIVRPGSHCPRCGHALSWYENVPLLSWAVLGGRCRSCKEPISIRYPAVELLTGLLFLAAGWELGPGWPLLRALLLVAFLIPLALIDLEQWIVPVEVTLLGTAAGLLSALPLGVSVLEECAIGAAAGFLVFWALERVALLLVVRVLRPLKRAIQRTRARLSRSEPPEREPDPTEALGAGDKWLLLLVGAFLGWRPLFGLLLLSSVQGALVGGTLLLLHGRAATEAPPPESPATEDGWTPEASALPYGPWIALAAVELALLGPWLAETFPSSLVAVVTGQPWVPP